MDRQTATDFFNHFLYDPQDKITIRFIRDRNKTGDPLQDATKGAYGLPSALMPTIAKQNKTDWGAFFMVNHSGSAGTKDNDIQHARALFIDIDNGDLPDYFPVEPSCILSREGGGGYHVYWFLSAPDADLKKWVLAQKTLIHFYKSDKTICNPARIMRIPGTVNHKEKYDNSPAYEITATSAGRYTVDEIIAAHADTDALHKIAVKSAQGIFGKEKLVEGEGRHGKLIRASFILNDYGFSYDETFTALKKIVHDCFVEPITDEKIHEYVKAQKSAKSEPGAKTVEKAMQEQAKIDRITEALKDWYYVRQQDAFYQEGSSLGITTTGFNAKFAYLVNSKNPAGFVFMHDCIKQYEMLQYDPAEPTDIDVVGGVARNMYAAPICEAIDADPQWFTDHIKYLIPEKTEREHFLNYMAFLIQHPGKKIMHGCLLIGKQGIGKSILQNVFEQIFGESNVIAPHNENLSGAFTGCFKHCQIMIINELMQVDKKDFNNKIKPFITEPKIEIREMYKAPYIIKNCMNIIAFSNHDNALYIDKDDRRWFIIHSPAEKKDAGYYDALLDAMENRSGEVLHFLQSRDISAFRAGATPPLTQAKRDIIDYSTSDLETWIVDAIESDSAPFDQDIIAINTIRDNLPRQLNNGFATINRIIKILRDNGAVKLGRFQSNGERRMMWAVRNHAQYSTTADAENAVKRIFGGKENDSFLQ